MVAQGDRHQDVAVFSNRARQRPRFLRRRCGAHKPLGGEMINKRRLAHARIALHPDSATRPNLCREIG
jgi:hypothetical protein